VRFVLVELRLENYAVIDNVAVEFAAGLNLLTGETGAGKSILIDALALLLGERASSEVIRSEELRNLPRRRRFQFPNSRNNASPPGTNHLGRRPLA